MAAHKVIDCLSEASVFMVQVLRHDVFLPPRLRVAPPTSEDSEPASAKTAWVSLGSSLTRLSLTDAKGARPHTVKLFRILLLK
jgi:hypothetical protein